MDCSVMQYKLFGRIENCGEDRLKPKYINILF